MENELLYNFVKKLYKNNESLFNGHNFYNYEKKKYEIKDIENGEFIWNNE